MKRGEESEKNKNDDQDAAEMLRRMVSPESAAFDIHVEIGNDDERNDDQRGNQNTGDEGRKEVQQLLKAKEIPRRLGGVGSEQGIGELFQWRVPEERHDHHGDHQHLKRNRFADQEVRKSHQLWAAFADNFR